MTIKISPLPRELFKDYADNFKASGHDEALRVLRFKIVARYGHAWYMSNKERIWKECAAIEKKSTPEKVETE